MLRRHGIVIVGWGILIACAAGATAASDDAQPKAEAGSDESLAASLGFEASGVELLGWIPLEDFPGNQSSGSDVWGYVSPSGREYAIMGLHDGTAFVEVTDPPNASIVGYVPAPGSIWRDMKVHGHYAYIVSFEGDGLQIVDLEDIDGGVVNHVATSHLNGFFFVAHNIALNTESGYAYPVASDINSGITAVDLSNPVNPQIAGMWTEQSLHDVLVVSYTEGQYAGREIAFGFAEGSGLVIVDVTTKENMFTMSSTTYPNLAYCHQGWLGEDRKYLYIDDELDELFNNVDTTTTYVIDVEDLDDPQFVTSFTSGLPAIDHNLMVRGSFLFEANYNSGLRVFDVSDIDNITEAGFFDTYPENDFPDFDGAWAPYTDLPSGVVLVSDRDRGLFILDVTEITGKPLLGDGDGDGDVDIFDFEIFHNCVGGPGGELSPECAVMDMDNDADVDRADFWVFQVAYQDK